MTTGKTFIILHSWWGLRHTRFSCTQYHVIKVLQNFDKKTSHRHQWWGSIQTVRFHGYLWEQIVEILKFSIHMVMKNIGENFKMSLYRDNERQNRLCDKHLSRKWSLHNMSPSKFENFCNYQMKSPIIFSVLLVYLFSVLVHIIKKLIWNLPNIFY